MPQRTPSPTRIATAGNKPKVIEAYIGRVSGTGDLSIARMNSAHGWVEPAQRPEFDQYALLLSGIHRVECEEGALNLHAGQAVTARSGEWIRPSSPEAEGAEYVAKGLPAFSPATAHRGNP